ncbi:MAG: hypothetical protein QG612_2621 [Pseudomonadota bacterium]|nr:hypothetical protein [Pseudomonadota bacterium]
MNRWGRGLILGFVGVFAALALGLAMQGDWRSATGAFWPAALAAPLLLEACWPGKYGLRRPASGLADTPLNRLRQFRVDHPGWDGTLVLGAFSTLALAFTASLAAAFLRTLATRG